MRVSVPLFPIYSHTIWTGITVIYLYDCTVSPRVRSSWFLGPNFFLESFDSFYLPVWRISFPFKKACIPGITHFGKDKSTTWNINILTFTFVLTTTTINFAWFWSSAVKELRTAIIWASTQKKVVISYEGFSPILRVRKSKRIWILEPWR